jgi:hypothetical protein
MNIKNEHWIYFIGGGIILSIFSELMDFESVFIYILIIASMIYGLILYLKYKKQKKD